MLLTLVVWTLAACSTGSVSSSSNGASAADPGVAATKAAQHLLDAASVSPKSGPPCSIIKSGKIGPLSAPIYWCAYPTGAGDVVKYSSSPLGNSGIAYHPGSAATLALYDDCVFAIGTNWWMYERADPGCPSRYRLVSGP